jgi:hypothetical protein
MEIATNLLEGIANDKITNHQPTLGKAIEGCNVFSHEDLRTCVKDFYKFASDYSNIRHAGTPASKAALYRSAICDNCFF